MKLSKYVLFKNEKYLVLKERGDYLTICNGDYSYLGENAITVKKKMLHFYNY